MLSPALQRSAAAKTLASYSSPSLIIPRLRHREPVAVVGELCSTLEHAGRLGDPLSFFNAVISHEQIHSTLTPPGWAMPHGRVRNLPGLSVAVGLSAEPLRWFGAAAESVRVVFLFAVPETDGATYLTLLGGLAKLSQTHPLLTQFTQATDRQVIFEILQQIPLRRSAAAARRG